MIHRWIAITRWREWVTSKQIFHLAMAEMLVPAEMGAGMVLLSMITVAGWAAFGYAVNDVADAEFDIRAGKPNRAQGLPLFTLVLLLSAFAFAAIGTTSIWSRHWVGVPLVALGILLAALYSLPPVRFKERGIMGIVIGSVAQWVLPILALATLAPALSGGVLPAILLALSIGARWMAVHQLLDMPADEKSNVKTYALHGRIDPVRLIHFCFAAEIASLFFLFAFTWPVSAPAVFAFVVWVVRQVLWTPKTPSFSSRLLGYERAPLADYYFFLAPLALSLARVHTDIAWLGATSGVVLLGWCYIQMMVGDFYESRSHDQQDARCT